MPTIIDSGHFKVKGNLNGRLLYLIQSSWQYCTIYMKGSQLQCFQ